VSTAPPQVQTGFPLKVGMLPAGSKLATNLPKQQ